MLVLRKLAFLALALVFLPTVRASEDTKKADTDEQTITGTVVEVMKDGTLVIELTPSKRDLNDNKDKQKVNVKTDNNTKFNKVNKKSDGTQTQSQCQFKDVKKGDKVNCKVKGKNTNNKKATNVNINSTNNPNSTGNPNN